MLNLFFHPYVRWLRDRSQDDPPGFNSDESDALPGAGAPIGTVLVAPPAPQHPAWPRVLTSTLGSQSPLSPAPPADLPGLRVTPQHNLPGFQVKPQDELIGFNLNDNGMPPGEGTWANDVRPEAAEPEYPDSAQTLPLPPGVESPLPSVPLEIPDWLDKLLAIPLPRLSSVSDPWTGRRIVPYEPLINPLRSYPTASQAVRRAGDARAYVAGIESLPSLGSVEALATQYGTSFDTPERPIVQDAMWNASPQRVKDGETYAQARGIDPSDPSTAQLARQVGGIPQTLSVNRNPDTHFVFANAGDHGVQQLQQQTPLPQEERTQQKSLGTPLGTGQTSMMSSPRIGALPIQPSVYSPGNDAGQNLLELVQGAPENKAQGLAAEAAELEAIVKADPKATTAQQIRIYAEGAPSYMVADIVFSRTGVARVAIVEVKSGAGDLTPQQIEKLGEAARTGKIYIVNEKAAGDLRIQPRVTFAAQRILPLVSVVGGNHEAIARQLRNQGLEVVPEGVGRRGRPARLLIVVPPT